MTYMSKAQVSEANCYFPIIPFLDTFLFYLGRSGVDIRLEVWRTFLTGLDKTSECAT